MPGQTHRQHTKERYERVLQVIDHQTSGAQRPGALPRTIVHTLASDYGGRYEPDGVRSALTAAARNDEIFVWLDEEGRKRVSPADRDTLERVVAEQNQREHPNIELIERVSSFLEANVDE